jgi:hypothetical protein
MVMTDLFKVEETDLKNGTLVISHIDPGYCGSIEIYPFNTLHIELPETIEQNSRAYLNIIGKEWKGGFENPSYVFKDKEPYNRGSQPTYIGTSFKDLDIIPTSDGGRFFSLKKLFDNSNMSTSTDYDAPREISSVHSLGQLKPLSQDLGMILELSAVPKADIRNIQEEIFRKLNYDVKLIDESWQHITPAKQVKAVSSITDLIVDFHDKV